jgi:hypothetical protein
MSWTREDAEREAAYDRLYNEIGPQWMEDHGQELYQEHYDEAVKEFTAERLKSYYVAHPDLAQPAVGSLAEATVLLQSHPRASLVIATTAMELAVKVVLLQPIVFGLVHNEGLAGFITELATKHTGMERFQNLLTAILAQFGGVDLKSFTRLNSTKTLWKEIDEVQRVRNAAIHRGETVSASAANLAVAVATTLLNEIFPQVLRKLELHLHEPGIVCSKLHGITVPVYFLVKDRVPSISGVVILDLESIDLNRMPPTLSGRLGSRFSNEEATELRSLDSPVPMWLTSTLVQYEVRFASDSDCFTGTQIS